MSVRAGVIVGQQIPDNKFLGGSQQVAGAIDVAEVPVGVHLLKRVASGRDPTAAATTTAWLRRAPAQAQRLRALPSLAPPAPICSADRATEQLPIGGGPHVVGLSQALRQARPLRIDTARRRPHRSACARLTRPS